MHGARDAVRVAAGAAHAVEAGEDIDKVFASLARNQPGLFR